MGDEAMKSWMLVLRSVLPATTAGVAVVRAPLTAADVPVCAAPLVADALSEPPLPGVLVEPPEAVELEPLVGVGFVVAGSRPTPVGALVALLLL